MSDQLVSGLIQLAISLGGAGVLVQLLLLRSNRRKIAGEATASEANAASTLSGAAIQMVENAQRKEKDAEDRADAAHSKLEERSREYEDRRERDAAELEARAWLIHHLQMRNAVLENVVTQTGVEIPPEPEYDTRGRRPPLPANGPRPALPSGEEVGP